MIIPREPGVEVHFRIREGVGFGVAAGMETDEVL